MPATVRRCAGSSGTVSTGGGSSMTIGSWNASITYSPDLIMHSGSAGMRVPVGGTKTWNGSYMCYGAKPCSAGDEIGFSGNSNTVSVSGDAIVTSVSCTFDFASCGVIQWNVSFQGNGPASIGGGTTNGNGNSRSSSPDIATAAGGSCSLSTDTVSFEYTESCEVSGGFATSESDCWLLYCVAGKSGTFSAQVQGYPPGVQVGEEVSASASAGGASVGGSYVITEVSTSVDNNSSEPITHTINGTLNPS